MTPEEAEQVARGERRFFVDTVIPSYVSKVLDDLDSAGLLPNGWRFEYHEIDE